MNYLYLIRKKEYINQDIFKVGIINDNKKDNINKEHQIILFIKNEYNCINFDELIDLLKKTFEELKDKKNYFIGNSEKIMLFIIQYFKFKYCEIFNKVYMDEKNKLVEKICDSTVIENSEKFNQLIKLHDNKNNINDINIKNYLEQLDLNNQFEYDFKNLLNDVLIKKINNLGYENMDFFNSDTLNDLLDSENISELINKFILLVHFNNEWVENQNIDFSNPNSLKIYKNDKWVEKKNKKKIYKKIFLMNKYKLHLILLKWFIINEDDEISNRIIHVLKFF
jgi:hypothetical protein